MRFTPSRSRSSSQLSRRSIALAFLSLPLAGTAHASRVAASPLPFDSDLQRARAKVTAYLDVIDATFPLQAMWRRYTNLVNPDSGPTGREVRINGLSVPQDIRLALAAAAAQRNGGPAFADCDAALEAFIRQHGETVPLIVEAAAYFEAGAHRDDGGQKARDFHARLRKAVPMLLAARADLQAKLEPIRAIVERAELSALERAYGRDGRWHIRRSTVEARRVMEVFPSAGGVIDLDRLDAALAAYDRIVEDTEAFGRDNPEALMVFARAPRGFAEGIRRVRELTSAFPASPRRWAPEIGDIDAPFQTLTKLADVLLRGVA